MNLLSGPGRLESKFQQESRRAGEAEVEGELVPAPEHFALAWVLGLVAHSAWVAAVDWLRNSHRLRALAMALEIAAESRFACCWVAQTFRSRGAEALPWILLRETSSSSWDSSDFFQCGVLPCPINLRTGRTWGRICSAPGYYHFAVILEKLCNPSKIVGRSWSPPIQFCP